MSQMLMNSMSYMLVNSVPYVLVKIMPKMPTINRRIVMGYIKEIVHDLQILCSLENHPSEDVTGAAETVIRHSPAVCRFHEKAKLQIVPKSHLLYGKRVAYIANTYGQRPGGKVNAGVNTRI